MPKILELKQRIKDQFKYLIGKNPCYLGNGEYDHDWEYIDDSFDHEYGTESGGHVECNICGAESGKIEDMPDTGYYDDYDDGSYLFDSASGEVHDD